MNTLEIPELQRKIEYPSCWEECSPSQVLFIFCQTIDLLAGRMTMDSYLLRIFFHLTQIRIKHPDLTDRHLTAEQRIVKYDNMARACRTVDFMFPGGLETPVFEYASVANQLPHIKIGRDICHAPADALLDVTFGEYRMACDLYRQYLSGSVSDAAARLVSVLYRPVGPLGGRAFGRLPFDAAECDHRSHRATKLPEEVLFYVATWFGACDRYIKTEDLVIEGRRINLSCLFTKATGTDDGDGDVSNDGNLGLLGIQLALAESGTFGDMDGVDRANLYTVLIKLYQWKKENDKTKRLYDTNRRS